VSTIAERGVAAILDTPEQRLATVIAEEEAIDEAVAPKFVIASGFVIADDPSTEEDAEDPIASDIREGLLRYNRGHDKAAVAALADALNAIVKRKDIHGGAWY